MIIISKLFYFYTYLLYLPLYIEIKTTIDRKKFNSLNINSLKWKLIAQWNRIANIANQKIKPIMLIITKNFNNNIK